MPIPLLGTLPPAGVGGDVRRPHLIPAVRGILVGSLAEQTQKVRLLVVEPFDASAVRAAYDPVAHDYAGSVRGRSPTPSR